MGAILSAGRHVDCSAAVVGGVVLVLCDERERSDDFSGLPESVVEGLRRSDARALNSVVPWPLDDRVHEQIVRTRAATRWRCSSCPGACRSTAYADAVGSDRGGLLAALARSKQNSGMRREPEALGLARLVQVVPRDGTQHSSDQTGGRLCPGARVAGRPLRSVNQSKTMVAS